MSEVECFDAIVIGAGLKEQMIGGLLCLKGKKVLFVSCPEIEDITDTIDSKTQEIILEHCKKNAAAEQRSGVFPQVKEVADNIFPEFMKKSNDLFKEFGDVRRWVTETGLLRLLEIDYKKVTGDIYRVYFKHRIPLDADELLDSGLMGMLEKRRYLAFRDYCVEYRQDVKRTHKDFDATLPKNSGFALFTDFGFDEFAYEYCGQAVARYWDKTHMSRPAFDLIRRVQLLHNNLAGNAVSPYFFPLYRDANGVTLKDQITGWATQHGGEYKAATKIEILSDCEKTLPIDAGKSSSLRHVKIDEKIWTCKVIVCHPAYAPSNMCKKVGEVCRRPILFKSFEAMKDLAAAHWQIPFKQMRDFKDKASDICFTLLDPNYLLSNDSPNTIIGMIEALDDKGKDGILQDVVDKIKDGLEFAQFRDSRRRNCHVHEYVKSDDSTPLTPRITSQWKPVEDGTISKVFVTDNSDPTPFEVICGDAADILTKILKVLVLDPPVAATSAAATPHSAAMEN